ncbi:MAG TPA: hypothetical protein VGC45_15865 [Gryllotalpicola sp.]
MSEEATTPDLAVVQLGEHDWICIHRRTLAVRYTIHQGPHAIGPETFIQFRAQWHAVDRRQRHTIGWGERLEDAVALVQEHYAEQQRRSRGALMPSIPNEGWARPRA